MVLINKSTIVRADEGGMGFVNRPSSSDCQMTSLQREFIGNMGDYSMFQWDVTLASSWLLAF